MRITSTTVSFSIALVLCLGCVADPKPTPPPQPTASADASNAVDPPKTPPPTIVMPSDSDRDPFAKQQALPPIKPPPNDVARKAKKYDVGQLRLVGIVGGDGQPRAMFVDPRGKGWIVERGDRIGLAELHVDHFTGWRVDKIRTDDVVLRREDKTRPDQTEETRVLALHTTPEPLDIDD